MASRLYLLYVGLLLSGAFLAEHADSSNPTLGAGSSNSEHESRYTKGLVTDSNGLFHRQSARATCSADAFSKQTCLFRNVCFFLGGADNADTRSLAIVLQGVGSSSSPSAGVRHAEAMLQKHLDRILAGVFSSVEYITHDSNSSANPLALTTLKSNSEMYSRRVKVEHSFTVLWRAGGKQYSFGHSLINEVYPMFLALSDHLQDTNGIPHNLQVLVTPNNWEGGVLRHLISDMISPRLRLLVNYLPMLVEHAKAGVCFRNLLLGDGGYVAASRASLANSGMQESHTYATTPSMFNSKSWWNFRSYAMQVAGVLQEESGSRPLILLNDKRYYEPGKPELQDDRRMILHIEMLADEIRTAYPMADVISARFRDLEWPDQLRLLSAATVFITTQGSSAFRLVFLPADSTCIMVGSPELPGEQQWLSFHELDRWFPLSYVHFERYQISHENTTDYQIMVRPGHWQPPGEDAARRWWLYNAHVRLQMDRLAPMLDKALSL